jgi:hypothetical protein
MGSGVYSRLLAWAEMEGHDLKVAKLATASGDEWTIGVSVDEPVTFSTNGRGESIDDAAEQVLADLQTVGVTVE